MRYRKDGEPDKRTTGERKAPRHGRTPFNLNTVLYLDEQGKERIDWTCPKCGHRNVGIRWYGREQHYCLGCALSTDIKGSTVSLASLENMPVM